ncbi:hypothetical protein PR202_gb12153 [Eleusine coracana subsp. coracana]|uniref:F-box domain-containing protein n=1 Tax=Eleusine coracana subsp. coracana TaxID=191504 RepID=A0AAV5EQ97_ELECO|nr:hypothetical protein PR202_gb12153 [Eleusine coracana subsp. coracana]
MCSAALRAVAPHRAASLHLGLLRSTPCTRPSRLAYPVLHALRSQMHSRREGILGERSLGASMANPSRGHLQAPPPPLVAAGASAPSPIADAPSITEARPPPSPFAAVSTPARPTSNAADSKVLSVEVEDGDKRRVKKQPAKQFRAPIAPMTVKSLGTRMLLSGLGGPSPVQVARECNMSRLPDLIDDVTVEIFLRLPPDKPENLMRASLVYKHWFRLLSNPDFLHRYRAFHRAPPLLGLLHSHQVLQGDPIAQLSPPR